MDQYQSKPEIVEAVQWIKAGDHSKIKPYSGSTKTVICARCGKFYIEHGIRMIDSVRYAWVCPETWIVTHRDGRIEYLADAEFKNQFVEVPK